MNKITQACFLGAVLLAGTASVLSASRSSQTSQASTSTKPKHKTSSTTSPKSKKRNKAVAAKPKGQKAPTPDRIKEIQTALQREGAYEGQPSGRWDDATVLALKKFQDKNGLNANGKIDALSLEKLGLGSGTAGKGAPVPVAGSAPSPNPPPNSAQ